MTTSTIFDLRQSLSRDVLTQIANNAANISANVLMRSIDSELTMPLQLTQSYPASHVINIGPITISNPQTGRVRSAPPILGIVPVCTYCSIVVDSTGAGVVSPFVMGVPSSTQSMGMTANQFLKIGICLSVSAGTAILVLTKGTTAGTLVGASTPPIYPGSFPIGYMVIQTDGSNNTSVISNANLYQYIGGESADTTKVVYNSNVISNLVLTNVDSGFFPVDSSSGAVQITLSRAGLTVLGMSVTVKDIAGQAQFTGKTITIIPYAGERIDGVVNNAIVLDGAYYSVTFVCNGVNGWWVC